MFESLRSRLALSNLFIVLLGLVAVVAVSTQLLANRSEDLSRARLKQQTFQVSAEVHTLFQQSHEPSGKPFKDTIRSFSNVLQERIIVRSLSGAKIVDTAAETPFTSGSWHPYDLQALKQGRSVAASLQSQHLIAFQAPLYGSHGRLIGAVLLVAKLKDIRPDLGSMVRIMLVAIATALLAWLAIGLYFAISISGPLLRVREGTEEMARGNYAVQVPVRGHSEISQLATSFNAMARQVQRSNQILRDFVANVSHDLRTPLTLIAGFSQALIDGTAEHDEVELSAGVIHDESIKMQHLVDDLLQLTRLESGLLTLDRHPVEVYSFVQSAIERIARAHGTDPIPALVNHIPADTPPISADPERLERVLRNLLENAIAYTPSEGEIVVSARRLRSGTVEISVSDTGIGIAADQISRIFERFYRSDKSRERAGGHSGLGLAIVREIVEAHGGGVTVQSTEGHGSTFRFTIPAALEGERPAEQRIAGEGMQRVTS